MQNSHDYEKQVISAAKQFASSINSKSKVFSDMSLLVDATNKLPLSGLDYWERLIRSEFYNALNTSTNSSWKFWEKPSQILTWLDLVSWDGYTREKTLRTLSGAAPNSFFFALAIRRLNDWVPQVRKAAREKLPLVADATDPKYVVDALCVALSNWNSWGRIEQVDKDVVLEIISKEAIGNALKSKIISSASGPMASLMAQVGRTTVLDKHLTEIAKSAVQPSVRSKAFRSQFEKRMVWLEGRKFEWTDIRYCEGRVKPIIGERDISVSVDFNELLEKSSTDTSSMVRRVAAEMLIRELENMGEGAVKLASLFASDKSSTVAERGRFALKKLAEFRA